jgi:hypothetical protein
MHRFYGVYPSKEAGVTQGISVEQTVVQEKGQVKDV